MPSPLAPIGLPAASHRRLPVIEGDGHPGRSAPALSRGIVLALVLAAFHLTPFEACAGSDSDPRQHWAFLPPANPAVPQVRDPAWPRTPIDRFILHHLESAGLRPAPPADRRTLIRRATFDLCGVPPTAEETQAFLADPAPDAFGRLVERLLASPRYGERWGRHWLDVARYADTKGYVYYYEESRFVHPHAYRDWVIRAFNEDLPYDRFLMLQIAADQLVPNGRRRPPTNQVSTVAWPPAVMDPSVAALGFLTLGRRFLDLEPDIVDDRIDVVMRGTQGLTVGCARCHDHKYDPIPTRDYYSLYGVFQGSEERLVALEPPPAPDAWMPFARARSYLEYERGVRERVGTLEAKFKAASDEVADRLRARTREYLVAVLDAARLPSDANVRPQPEDINPFNVRQWEQYLFAHAKPTDPILGPWHAFAQLPADRFAEEAAEVADRLLHLSRDRKAALNPWVEPILDPAPSSMVQVAERYGDLFERVHREWQSLLRTNATAPPHPARFDDPDKEAVRQVLYGPEAPVRVPSGTVIELDVHLYFDDPNRVALAKLQMELEQWMLSHTSAPLHALILEDRAHPAAPAVFRRGNPLQRGEPVPRQFLEILEGPGRRPFDHGSGRLDLARAIARPDNPLTARVLVNRVWARHFGEGLVRTLSDFGLRSEPPTHPELLDWLARWFVAEGWSIKRLHRLILNSAAYQQASSEPAATRDPENRWLARFPRQRLEYESFRDALLAVTGELDERMGGPGVPLDQVPFSRRRTVYGFIDRKGLPGMFRVFDFANPDMHSPRRHATTTPQQALFLLNHPFVMERARALGRRLDALPSPSFEDRVDQLYLWVLQRPPSAGERADARRFLDESREPEGPPSTDIDASEGGPAQPLNPWEAFAQVLLLSNEFMFVD